ncbi:hypothetical protein B4907_11510 [Yersinia kristensenii]|uniref:DUF2560 family protein n=1 Tax=Yersinia TaxID=629 RepID=UPI0005E32C21|nr:MULTISPECIES: DUF2560 family protein [Yersinia]MDN0103913.1 DUF2560 family protein [Yersinia bercovieri]OWF83349.1 hypothetical protein B4907_11510 [Yersinia kristensenii]QDW34431.1 DUF2560 family protein [Yersinia sp. KBS0713]CNL10987.1 Protein of uncharacterised function (DUF2560) [Yersinia frederiksenii]
MSEQITGLTPIQASRLEILRLVMKDTAAAQKAIDFIKDDPLKQELFKDQYALAANESGLVSRTEKAIKECQEALSLFD